MVVGDRKTPVTESSGHYVLATMMCVAEVLRIDTCIKDSIYLAFRTNGKLRKRFGINEEVYPYVEKPSDGGKVAMPTDKTFWNSAYGSLVDKFGISWGIEFELKRR